MPAQDVNCRKTRACAAWAWWYAKFLNGEQLEDSREARPELLKRGIRHALSFCRFVGFDPTVAARNIAGLPGFFRDLQCFRRMNNDPTFRPALRSILPVLRDSADSAGDLGVYFYQDLWAARKIFSQRPSQHIDIGSRVDGFVSHLLVFMPVSIVDIRPMRNCVKDLSVIQDDATELQMFQSGSVESISSLHVAEHFGLGRYSDPIDPVACFRFMAALQRVLAPKGRLYFSVPVGRQRVEFNAHRIFDVRTILRAFGGLELLSFSFVGDDQRFYENVCPEQAIDADCGCGLFEFTKT